MQIGFIGLGHMGQHMARHVAEAGHDLAAFDLRTDAVTLAISIYYRGSRPQ